MVAIAHPASPLLTRRTAARPAAHAVAATYRRRRLAVVGALLVLLALASLGLQSLVAGARPSLGADARPVARIGVVVAPGDTVWSIASAIAPGEDPRPVVDAIVAANGGASLVAGQRIDVVLP